MIAFPSTVLMVLTLVSFGPVVRIAMVIVVPHFTSAFETRTIVVPNGNTRFGSCILDGGDGTKGTSSVALLATRVHNHLKHPWYGHHPHHYYHNRNGPPLHSSTTVTTTTTLHEGIVIRDWKEGDGTQILDLLRRSLGDNDNDTNGGFDPEGPLLTDCGDEESLRVSYDTEDGGRMMVATTTTTTKTKTTTTTPAIPFVEEGTIVGTAGLVVGTTVAYLSSGASVSSAVTTGAMRRVCAVRSSPQSTTTNTHHNEDDDDDDDNDVLGALVTRIEETAVEAGAEELITLAYPSSTTNAVVHRPTAVFLGRRGYTPSSSMVLKGVDAIPYRKILDRSLTISVDAGTTTTPSNAKGDGSSVESETEMGTGKGGALILAITTTVSIAAALLVSVASFMGLELLPSGTDNRGIGSPLSTQELERLERDETLQRTDLDGVRMEGGSSSVRQWKDLTFEERQEEGALMTIIQGRNPRLK